MAFKPSIIDRGPIDWEGKNTRLESKSIDQKDQQTTEKSISEDVQKDGPDMATSSIDSVAAISTAAATVVSAMNSESVSEAIKHDKITDDHQPTESASTAVESMPPWEIEENHSMRFFSINEINELAKKTGFELVEAKPFLQEGKLSKNSWGAFFILKKI